MQRRWQILSGVSLAASVAALLALPAISQTAANPVARYTIDAGTTSGMGAMNQGGGIGGALGVLRGGGNNQVSHELMLRLGSTRAPTGAPTADHFMPQGARLGVSVPLETPPRSTATPPGPGQMPQGQMPQGRLLLFWGCGEHAPPNQPVVIDFSRLARGQVPPGLYAQPVNLPDVWNIYQSNSTTYGEWPNQRSSQPVPAGASLLGAHRIASTYAPEINFTLADDFMPALQATSSDMASGAVTLNWNALPKATGYYAWGIASGMDGGQSRDMVWWTSASTQQFAGALQDWLSPAAVARLVSAGTVMPPSQTTCTVPAEVKAAGGPILMTFLTGYGPQADFAYPPRPANTRTPWRPEWIARVRFKSSTTLMAGMPGFGDQGQAQQGQQPEQPAGLPRCRRGLRGIAERAAGLCQ
jgi:hypothetical protein